jgi:hypothetical protein
VSTKMLFDLTLQQLPKLEMEGAIFLHLIWCARTRMIKQGTYGLSQGNLDNGSWLESIFWIIFPSTCWPLTGWSTFESGYWVGLTVMLCSSPMKTGITMLTKYAFVVEFGHSGIPSACHSGPKCDDVPVEGSVAQGDRCDVCDGSIRYLCVACI